MQRPPNPRIDPNTGLIKSGMAEKGYAYRDANRTAGFNYFEKQIIDGNIKLEHKGSTFRYRIKRTPHIAWGSTNELGLLRAQHFLKDNQNKWMTRAKFNRLFGETFENLKDAFKRG